AAGLDREDVLLQLAGKPLKNQKDLQKLLAKHKPGDVVPLEVRARDGQRTVQVTLQEDPVLEVIPAPATTAAQLAFRAAWLNGKAK
ncbi:MAG: PDZ domain-containing protein, partial [Hymenobacter sp.]|nr:PDZ domain-containing protein [Hymenobacter sp.]